MIINASYMITYIPYMIKYGFIYDHIWTVYDQIWFIYDHVWPIYDHIWSIYDHVWLIYDHICFIYDHTWSISYMAHIRHDSGICSNKSGSSRVWGAAGPPMFDRKLICLRKNSEFNKKRIMEIELPKNNSPK